MRYYSYKKVVPFFQNQANENGELFIIYRGEHKVAACMSETEVKLLVNTLNNSHEGPIEIANMFSKDISPGYAVDFICLTNGNVWSINDDCAVLNKCMEGFHEVHPPLTYISYHYDYADRDVLSLVNLTFVNNVCMDDKEILEITMKNDIVIRYQF